MVRGVPWDELETTFEKNKHNSQEETYKEVEIIPEERDITQDIKSILKRVAFGVVVSKIWEYLLRITINLLL